MEYSKERTVGRVTLVNYIRILRFSLWPQRQRLVRKSLKLTPGVFR